MAEEKTNTGYFDSAVNFYKSVRNIVKGIFRQENADSAIDFFEKNYIQSLKNYLGNTTLDDVKFASLFRKNIIDPIKELLKDFYVDPLKAVRDKNFANILSNVESPLQDEILARRIINERKLKIVPDYENLGLVQTAYNDIAKKAKGEESAEEGGLAELIRKEAA